MKITKLKTGEYRATAQFWILYTNIIQDKACGDCIISSGALSNRKNDESFSRSTVDIKCGQ